MAGFSRRQALLAAPASAGLGMMACSTTSPEPEVMQRALHERQRACVAVRDFGALGDGSGATVAEWLVGGTHDRGYGDLAALQADYPFVTSLDWTIDQTALWAAMAFADARDAAVFCASGTYVVDAAVQDAFEPTSRELFFLYGEGPATVLKRKDGSQNDNNQRVLYVRFRNGPCRFVGLHDLAFDGNARNNPRLWQPGETVSPGSYRRTEQGYVYRYAEGGRTGESAPEFAEGSASDGTATAVYADTIAGATGATGFWWEHSHTVLVSVEEGHPVETVLFSNVWCRDAVADHLACIPTYSGPNHLVKTLIYNNIACVDRARSRADIIVGGYVEQVFISNVHCTRLEFEHSLPPPGRITFNLANVRTEILDLGGHLTTPHLTSVNGVNVRADWTALGGVSCRFANSVLRLRDNQSGDTARWIKIPRGIWTDCVLRLPYRPDTNTAMGLGFMYADEDGAMNHHCTFERCHFELDADESVTAPLGYLIRGYTAVAETISDDRILELIECTFDPRIERTVECSNIGTLITRRCRFAARREGVSVRSVAGRRTAWISHHDDFTGTAADRKFRLESSYGDSRVHLYHEGIEDADAGFTVASSSWRNVELRSARLRWIGHGPPTGGGIAGDIARLKAPEPGQPVEWICTRSHPTTATWKVLRSVAA